MSMFDPELEQFEAFESEEEFRGRHSSGRRPPSRATRYRPRPFPTKQRARGPRVTADQSWAQPATYPEDSGGPAAAPSERVRWLQFCLNRATDARLPVDGVLSPAMRNVIRNFQRQEGLPISGIAGPDTEEALKSACRTQRASASQDAELEFEAEEEWPFEAIGQLATRGGQAVRRAGAMFGRGATSRIINLTALADKSRRKGTRDLKKVRALVLHQMACCFRPKDPLKRFLSIGAHFAILPDGRILQMHPASALVWASNGFNSGSVAVEFAGNFPDTKGRWWKGDQYGRNRPTAAQLEAGRDLVRHLVRTLGITTILAHRQSSNSRNNDPGPDIWYHVGQWAVEKLGLRDGGPSYRHPAEGKPIPQEWRDWGRRGAAREMGEFFELEPHEAEEELWRGSPEGPLRTEAEAEEEFGQTQEMSFDEVSFATILDPNRPNATASGIYTIYKEDRPIYVGKATNLRQRLLQHKWCLTHLGIKPELYKVRVRLVPPEKLKASEARSVSLYRRKFPGQLTNIRSKELESEIFGEASEWETMHAPACGCRECEASGLEFGEQEFGELESSSSRLLPPPTSGRWVRRGRNLVLLGA